MAGRFYDLPDAGYRELVTGSKIGAERNKSVRATALWTPTERLDVTFKYEHQDSWQNGTPSEVGRCDLDFSTGNAGPLAPGVPALCALESAYGLSNLAVYNRESHGGGSVDLWDAIDFVNANGANVMPFVPIPRGLNLVNEYNHPQTRETDADIYVASFNWLVGRNTLSGITSYVTFDKEDWLDPDESAFAVFIDHRTEKFSQTAQEIRLTSPLDQKFSWMVGAYWQTHEANLQINVHYPFVLGPPVPGMVTSSDAGRVTENSDWTSVFFTGTWNVTSAFRFNIGGRYQESRKNGVYQIGRALLPAGATHFDPYVFQPTPALDRDVDSNDFLPEYGFQWNPTGNIMMYVKHAEAFKAGGFVMNPPLGGVPPDPFTFLPEEASGNELGVKGTFFDNRLQLDIALFDTDFKNLQVNSFNGVAGRFQVRNAASSNTNGIEIDGRFLVGDRWSLGFNGGYNDAHYTYFPDGQCGPIQTRQWVDAGNPAQTCTADLSGRRPFLGAEWQFTLAPQVSFQVGKFSAQAGLNMTWVAGRDPFFVPPPGFPEDPLATIPDHHRFDLRVAFTPPTDKWELALYGRNITDEEIQTGGLQSGFFNQTSGTSNSEVHLYGISGKTFDRGARWGVQANYFFGRR